MSGTDVNLSSEEYVPRLETVESRSRPQLERANLEISRSACNLNQEEYVLGRADAQVSDPKSVFGYDIRDVYYLRNLSPEEHIPGLHPATLIVVISGRTRSEVCR